MARPLLEFPARALNSETFSPRRGLCPAVPLEVEDAGSRNIATELYRGNSTPWHFTAVLARKGRVGDFLTAGDSGYRGRLSQKN
jgi:hypothetical protein